MSGALRARLPKLCLLLEQCCAADPKARPDAVQLIERLHAQFNAFNSAAAAAATAAATPASSAKK
jgi:hypothetical protein